MPSVGFEATISEGERPQTYALDRAVNGICTIATTLAKYFETQTKHNVPIRNGDCVILNVALN